MGGYIKRKLVYEQVRSHNADIVLLQETHSSKNFAKLWRAEWGSAWYSSHGTSNARGVAILLNRKVSAAAERIHIRKDKDGRFLVLSMEIQGKLFVICNIYGPNSDSPEYFNNLIDTIHDLEFDHLIVGGDFNFVLDPTVDSRNRSPPHYRAREIVKKLMEEGNLSDIWRIKKSRC